MAGHQRACASCGTSNEEDARFCEDCGGALGRTCRTCGAEAKATRDSAERAERRSTNRMGTNRANDVTSHLFRACNARDIDAAVAAYRNPFVYDDRRRLSGDPIDDQRRNAGSR